MAKTYAVCAILIAVILLCVATLNRILTKVSPPAQKRSWLTRFHYAHRGLHNHRFPENSLAAFANAAKRGFAVEMDIQMTKDGSIVVFHDSELRRMTGAAGRVRDFTLAELKKLRLCGSKYAIPTLSEALRLIGGRVPVLIDIKKKGLAGEIERKLYELLKDYPGKYAVQSFSPFSMRWFRLNAPNILRGQLSCNFRFCRNDLPNVNRFFQFILCIMLLVVQLLAVNVLSRPNFISYEFHKVDCRLLQRLRKTGAPIFAWVVRSEKTYQRIKHSTDSVIFENFTPSENS